MMSKKESSHGSTHLKWQIHKNFAALESAIDNLKDSKVRSQLKWSFRHELKISQAKKNAKHCFNYERTLVFLRITRALEVLKSGRGANSNRMGIICPLLLPCLPLFLT